MPLKTALRTLLAEYSQRRKCFESCRMCRETWGVDPRNPIKVVRWPLPACRNGTGKTVDVAAIHPGYANAERPSGCRRDKVGMDDLAARMKAGLDLNYDVGLSHSRMRCRVVGQLGSLAGPAWT